MLAGLAAEVALALLELGLFNLAACIALAQDVKRPVFFRGAQAARIPAERPAQQCDGGQQDDDSFLKTLQAMPKIGPLSKPLLT